ncbi:MAG: ferritin [Candidatus Cloacimonetes bacterium]|jgi:ferritin|nr:ferritin [Candidatus Cloacimonadota bacterium]MBT6994184.1 ferritin [Candidatus Cloacimonadota bacterium]MBT7469727.1 ferritin [Candidatus Cloacimonadota bacterium]
MISKKVEQAINEQINKELYSEYFYLAMASYFSSEGLSGFENFFLVQVEEERFHMMKMYKFINEKGGRVNLKKIDAPRNEFKSPTEVFELAFKHEQFVTKSINELMDIAIAENDHATKSFLNWFVDEQVEEEDSMSTILQKLRMINGEGYGMIMLDKELSIRVFTPPVK